MHTFASMRSTPFMEIDDKGGDIVQRYESLEIKIVQREEIRSRGRTWTWTKREQHWRKEMDQIRGQETHTSRGASS